MNKKDVFIILIILLSLVSLSYVYAFDFDFDFDFGETEFSDYTGDCPLLSSPDPFGEDYSCGCASETACAQPGFGPGGSFEVCMSSDPLLCAAGHVCVDDLEGRGSCVPDGVDDCIPNNGTCSVGGTSCCSDDPCFAGSGAPFGAMGTCPIVNFEEHCGSVLDDWTCSGNTACVFNPPGGAGFNPEVVLVCSGNNYCYRNETSLSVDCLAKRENGQPCENNFECLGNLCNPDTSVCNVPSLPACETDDDCLDDATCSLDTFTCEVCTPGGECEECPVATLGAASGPDCNSNSIPDHLCPDTACSEGNVCNETTGECVPSTGCDVDSDCEDDEICDDSVCVIGDICDNSEDCADDEACFGDAEGSGECAPCDEADDEDDDELICHDDPCVGNDDPAADCDASGTGRSCSSVGGRTCRGTCVNGNLSRVSKEANCYVPSTCTCQSAPLYLAALGTSVISNRTCQAGNTCLASVSWAYNNGTSISPTIFSSMGITATSNPYTEQDPTCCGINLEPRDDQPVPGYGIIALGITLVLLTLFYVRRGNRKLLKS